MKKTYTLVICLIAFVSNSLYADPPTYVKVLYRVNAGGNAKPSIDTSNVNWERDNLTNPSPYIDTVAMGNKAFATLDSIPFDPSVPLSTHYMIFRSERGIIRWDIDAMEWNFPVAAGKKVEVRLYFAEIYFDSINKRVFDIEIEGDLLLDNYDIVADVGADTGVMKSFIVTSDGNLDIDLRREIQQPKVNGIEIIEIDEGTVAGTLTTKTGTDVSVYPNPFKDVLSIKADSLEIYDVKIYDSFGNQIENVNTTANANVDLSQYPAGIYFLNIASVTENKSKNIRLVKY